MPLANENALQFEAANEIQKRNQVRILFLYYSCMVIKTVIKEGKL